MEVFRLSSLVHTFMFGGRYQDNRTSVTLVNNTSKTQDITCSGGFRMMVLGGHIQNNDDVDRNCNVTKKYTNGTTALNLLATTTIAASATEYFPTSDMDDISIGCGAYPLFLDESEYIRFSWLAGGASSGGNSSIALQTIRVVKD